MRKLLVLGLCVLAAGCKRGNPGAQGGVKIGLVTDVGGRGDQSFNDGALRGLEMWAAGEKYTAGGYVALTGQERDASFPEGLDHARIVKLPVQPVVLQAKAQEDYEPDLDLLAGQDVELAIGVGFMLENAVEAAAKQHPKTRFLLIDSPILDEQNKPYTLPNVQSAIFRENESSYLAGALAALASKTGKIGFVGGMEVPLIRKFEAGYVAGARKVNPGIEVKRVYTGSFDDSSTGKRAALDLYAQGADVVYHAAGSCGLGVIQAAKEQGKYAIGVDSDQWRLAPENVLTSAVKRVDLAVYEAVDEAVHKKFAPGEKQWGLANGGVGLAPVRLDFPGKAAAMKKIAELTAEIVAGKLEVPATLDQLAAANKK